MSFFDDVYVTNYFDVNHNKLDQSKLVVFSPGPGKPKDYPQTSAIYNKIKGKKKILGICLGFQQILFNENGKIIHQKNVYHGFQSKINILKCSKLFANKQFLLVGRYHSLKLKEPYISKNLKITMRCAKTNIPMAFEDMGRNIYGFQFHPESFLTQNGKHLIQKIISA